MSTLLDSILDLVKGEAGELIGKAVGAAPDASADVTEAGVSTLLSGLGSKLDAEGPRAVEAVVRSGGQDGLLDDVVGYLKGGKFGDGGLATDGIFGTGASAVTAALGKQLGLGDGMGRRLLVMLAPLVLSFLKKGGLKGGGLGDLIKGALPAILGGKFGGLLGGLGLLGGGAAAASAVGGGKAAQAAARVESAGEAVAHDVRDVHEEPRRRGGIGWLAALAALILGLIIFAANCNEDDDPAPAATQTTQTTDSGAGAGALLDVAAADADGNYSTFLGLVESSGLSADLAGAGPFTVFAPTNDALAAVTIDTSDIEGLKQTLLGHVVSGNLASTDLTDGKLTTLAGTEIDVSTAPTITVGGVEVTNPDIAASNGVLHGVAGLVTGKVPTGRGLAQGIAGDYGPWRVRAWRDNVFAKLKPAVAARAETLDDFEGGFGIRINPEP